MLSIKGHSNLVILQLKNKDKCRSDKLMKYINAIRDTMEWFNALNLQENPREENNLKDKLVVATSTLQPTIEMVNGVIKLEINFGPSIPDNIDHW